MRTAAASPYPEGTPQRPHRHPRWGKVAAWAALAVIGLLLVVAVVGVIVLRSARFHNYVLSTIQRKASESIGTQVQLQN